jgi:predicted nucleotidyltransferase
MSASHANQFGLINSILNQLQKILTQYPHISSAKIYGSRAKGTFHDRSDIDIALIGNDITRFEVAGILLELDESNIPYSFDFNIYHEIKNLALKEHIDRIGKNIYPAP